MNTLCELFSVWNRWLSPSASGTTGGGVALARGSPWLLFSLQGNVLVGAASSSIIPSEKGASNLNLVHFSSWHKVFPYGVVRLSNCSDD